jgi:hypothetical protein
MILYQVAFNEVKSVQTNKKQESDLSKYNPSLSVSKFFFDVNGVNPDVDNHLAIETSQSINGGAYSAEFKV